MFPRSLIVISFFLTPTLASAQLAKPFTFPREYRISGLEHPGRPDERSATICLIRKKDGVKVCRTRAQWIAENARLEKLTKPS